MPRWSVPRTTPFPESTAPPSPFDTIRPVRRDAEGRVVLIDQTKLPLEHVDRVYDTADSVAQAITDMIVRGAPAIGVTAAFGLALGARTLPEGDFAAGFEAQCARMADTRPTAVNLFWAIAKMRAVVAERAADPETSHADLLDALDAEAQRIHDEDVAICQAIGRHGAELIPDGARILTHCNAGALATAGYGTALGVIRAAVQAGKRVQVFADETRPYLQGGRLTSWELLEDGIDVTVISDVAAGHLMATGEIDLAVVGSDRTVANGDLANKIGTYGVAVLCHRHGLPFYGAVPCSTLDLSLASGAGIPIEERSGDEVRDVFGAPIAPRGVKVRNPAFDVTPAELITAIITEHGVAEAPYEQALRALVDRAERGGPPDPRAQTRAGA